MDPFVISKFVLNLRGKVTGRTTRAFWRIKVEVRGVRISAGRRRWIILSVRLEEKNS
jgi:hypothetical protein